MNDSRGVDVLLPTPELVPGLLLVPPLLWFGTVYLGSLFALLAQSFYRIDDFTAQIVREPTLATYQQLVTQPANVDIVLRTLIMAIAVTIACAVIALPIATYMARYARGRMKAFFYVGVMLPMWTSYLVKVYAWRLLLAKEGIIAWVTAKLGLTGVAGGRARRARHRRSVAVVVVHRHVHRVRIHVAAVHDPAHGGGARARPGLAAAGLGGSRRAARRKRSATSCCRSPCPASPRDPCSRFR